MGISTVKKLGTQFGKIERDRLMILIVGGILLLVVSIPVNGKKESSTVKSRSVQTVGESQPAKTASEADSYKEQLEVQLEEILSKIEGAGKTEVFVSLLDRGYKQVEKDSVYEKSSREQEEQVTESEMRNEEICVYTSNEQGEEIPYICREQLPQVGGVLIVAQGGEKPGVQKQMKEAIMALFGLEEHKITIVKMKGDIS